MVIPSEIPPALQYPILTTGRCDRAPTRGAEVQLSVLAPVPQFKKAAQPVRRPLPRGLAEAVEAVLAQLSAVTAVLGAGLEVHLKAVVAAWGAAARSEAAALVPPAVGAAVGAWLGALRTSQ